MNNFLLLSAKVLNNVFGHSKGKNKYFEAWKYVYGIGLQGMGRIQGNIPEASGEEIVLQKVISSGKEKVVILDVGANEGQYSTLALHQKVPQKTLELHLFEPASFNIRTLQDKFTSTKYPGCHFVINQLALSDKNDVAYLYTDKEGSDLASLMNLKVPIRPFDESKKEKVQTETLDDYALRNNIEEVDLLKIDVEGAEYKVLAGATKLLESKRIKNIQFEFGAGNITARIFFHDFWDLLSSKYHFFQVLSDGIFPIKTYSVDMEIFKTTNYFLSLK